MQYWNCSFKGLRKRDLFKVLDYTKCIYNKKHEPIVSGPCASTRISARHQRVATSIHGASTESYKSVLMSRKSQSCFSPWMTSFPFCLSGFQDAVQRMGTSPWLCMASCTLVFMLITSEFRFFSMCFSQSPSLENGNKGNTTNNKNYTTATNKSNNIQTKAAVLIVAMLSTFVKGEQGKLNPLEADLLSPSETLQVSVLAKEDLPTSATGEWMLLKGRCISFLSFVE